MDPKLAKELEDFNKKKEDVFKNINLLNNLSESLVNSITDEESKIIQKKNKEIIEAEKKKTANELELLGLENSKMESFLEILNKKQELEMKYLEQMCDQHAKIHKLGEKYSFLDVEAFIPYDTQFTNQLVDAKRDYTKKRNSKKRTEQLEKEYVNTEKKEPENTQSPPPPPSVPPPSNPPPTTLPFPPVENKEVNVNTDFELDSEITQNEITSVDAEPPPPPRQPPPPQRRATISSPEGIAKRSPPPQRTPSLQDQLKLALAQKFSIANSMEKKEKDYGSDSDGSSWT